METVTKIETLRASLRKAQRLGEMVGVVPTMGAFHEGHLTLMRQANAENDRTVVTLFVNPTQFNDPADFEKYPRDPDRDARLAEAEGVDYLFLPSASEMYPEGFVTTVTVGGVADRLEGASRPGHFTGVATVVAKLLNIVGADRAYFGEKDWQQLQVVKRMAADLNLPTTIIPVPTVREPDGLAMSSRNVRLSAEQRRAAIVLSRALADVARKAKEGERDAQKLAARLREMIEAEPLARLDYAVVAHPETLDDIATVDEGALGAVAAFFGPVRLIDNRRL